MNNDQEIILAKISAVYDKPPFVKMETGQMEMILKCVGLGAYYDKYREYLEPYWYNGRFQNPVESYRIFVGLNSIFEDLLNERKGDEIISLLTELGNYIPGTILSDEARFAADFNKLRQLYNLMGLQIVSMEVDEYSSKFQVEPYLNEGNQIIQSFGMERWLKSKYQDVYEAYESALNSFSSGDLGAAIESCRTALTGIFSKYKGVPFQKAKWMLGMATLTGDFTGTQSADASEMTSIKNEIEAMGKRDIADFFEENLEGSYKKTKAIYSIYSMLSDYGTHRLEGTVEVAKNEDPKHTVIHIHGWSKALSVSVVAVAQNMHFPVLITLHDYFAVCPNGGFFNYQKKELCHLEPMSWKCISCNCDKRSYFQKIWRCMRQLVQNRYVKNAKDIHFAYISNRILTLSQPYLKSTKFHYLRNPIDLSDQMVMNHHCSNIYLCAGRVSEEKGVEDFCKAITEVQKNVDIRGQVVGVGPLVNTLKQKYPKIEFVGWVNSVQLTKYYQTARALVFPSICNEGSPLTIPEALSAGLPCIVTDCTSATETITDGINGLIYDTGDVEALKQKIQISLEDTVIDRFQKNIRDSFKCADYSYAAYIVQVNRLYDSILMEEQER